MYGSMIEQACLGDARAWAVTGRDRVRVGDATIEYDVRRSARRRKTVQISVDRDGVRVAAPAGIADRELRDIVVKRAPWILQHANAQPATAEPTRFVSGETLPYLGRDVRIVAAPAGRPSAAVTFDCGGLRIAVPAHLPEVERRETARGAVVEWYRLRAAEDIPARVDRWRRLLGEGANPRILIRDQRCRWGSCAADGTLRFNWRAMMLEPSLIDYIVVHELTHLKVRNHSAAFWNLVARSIPDVQQRRRRLREVGRTLPALTAAPPARPDQPASQAARRRWAATYW